MQSLAIEAESLCKQYRGLLKNGSFAHPQLKEYERQLGELLAQHSTAQSVSKEPCLVMYNKRYVFSGTQLLLHIDAVPSSSTDLICLALFTTHKDSLLFSDYYFLSRAQWNKANLIKSSQCKPFNLNSLHKINLMDDASHMDEPIAPSLSNSTSITTDDDNDEEHTENDALYDECRPFWLAEHMERVGETPTDCLQHYVQLLLDVVIWRRYFSDNEPLKKKTLAYYSRLITTHHGEMTLLFLSQMVEHNGHEMTESIHQARKDRKDGAWFIDLVNTRLCQEWLDTEILLFKEARWFRLLQHQGMELERHVAFIRHAMPKAVWPTWMSYTMNLYEDEAPVYWSELDDGNYEIRAEWLLKAEFDALLLSLPLVKGHSCLSAQLFQTVFMPCLYRCLLEDVRSYLFYVYYAEDNACNEARYQLTSLRNTYHYSREEMKEMSQLMRKHSMYSATSLFDLVAEVGDVCTPVVRKMVKKRPEFDASRTQEEINAKVPWYERHIKREEMPDIEDLGNKKLVPPCMQRIFNPEEAQRPHLGHLDRINIVRYLIDMAYSREEVVEFLCRGHQQDAEYQSAITTAYDSFTQQKRLNPRQIRSQHHSFGCSSLINALPPTEEKSFMRCVYVERAEKKSQSHRRNDYSKEEKDVFTRQCGACLGHGAYATRHPIQFALCPSTL